MSTLFINLNVECKEAFISHYYDLADCHGNWKYKFVDPRKILFLGASVVFGLPLALLFPGFSIWDVVPKVRIYRFHILSQHLTWFQLHTSIVAIVILFFSLYLEIRKRILDDMVEEVLAVKRATLTTVEAENEKLTANMKACVALLDASSDHYENLVLLHDELRQRFSFGHRLNASE